MPFQKEKTEKNLHPDTSGSAPEAPLQASDEHSFDVPPIVSPPPPGMPVELPKTVQVQPTEQQPIIPVEQAPQPLTPPEVQQPVSEKDEPSLLKGSMDLLKRVRRSSQQTPPSSTAPVAPVAQQKTETRKEIEDLLSKGLVEMYQAMSPQEQLAFRQKGEETASKIEVLIVTFRATAKRVVELIRAWLATIPRVNKYFLDQESKLKTDEILKLQRRLKKDEKLKRSIRIE